MVLFSFIHHLVSRRFLTKFLKIWGLEYFIWRRFLYIIGFTTLIQRSITLPMSLKIRQRWILSVRTINIVNTSKSIAASKLALFSNRRALAISSSRTSIFSDYCCYLETLIQASCIWRRVLIYLAGIFFGFATKQKTPQGDKD